MKFISPPHHDRIGLVQIDAPQRDAQRGERHPPMPERVVQQAHADQNGDRERTPVRLLIAQPVQFGNDDRRAGQTRRRQRPDRSSSASRESAATVASRLFKPCSVSSSTRPCIAAGFRRQQAGQPAAGFLLRHAELVHPLRTMPVGRPALANARLTFQPCRRAASISFGSSAVCRMPMTTTSSPPKSRLEFFVSSGGRRCRGAARFRCRCWSESIPPDARRTGTMSATPHRIQVLYF